MDKRPPTGTWAGHQVYQCRWCQFDRLDERPDASAVVDEHEQQKHPDEYLADLIAQDHARAAAAGGLAVPAAGTAAAIEKTVDRIPAPPAPHQE